MTSETGLSLRLRHFRLISAIAAQGQLSPAASALGMTQPAASRMLAEIEQILGEPVFARRARGMELTGVGQVLARRAHNLLLEVQQTAQEVADFRAGNGGMVRVGVVTGGAVRYVVPAIRRLRATTANAEVHVEVAPSEVLVRALLEGSLDFALGRIPPSFDLGDFLVSRARGESLELAVREGHPLAGRAQVPLDRLADYEWVMETRGAPLRQAVERVLLEAGAPLPRQVTNTSSLLVILALLIESDAIAPLPREVFQLLAVGRRSLGLKALKVAETFTVTPFCTLTLAERQLSPLALRLWKLVLDQLDHAATESDLR